MRYPHRILLMMFSLLCITSCQQTPSHEHFFEFPSQETSITTTVQDTIRRDPTLTNLGIHVETHQRVVSLSGYVKTIRQSDTADALARQVAEGYTVQNNIVVRK